MSHDTECICKQPPEDVIGWMINPECPVHGSGQAVKIEPLWSVKHTVNIGQGGPVADSGAASAAGVRLAMVGGSIYRAFDGLNCGIGHERAVEYLETVMPDAKAVGAALAFAMVAVESERLRHG